MLIKKILYTIILLLFAVLSLTLSLVYWSRSVSYQDFLTYFSNNSQVIDLKGPASYLSISAVNDQLAARIGSGYKPFEQNTRYDEQVAGIDFGPFNRSYTQTSQSESLSRRATMTRLDGQSIRLSYNLRPLSAELNDAETYKIIIGSALELEKIQLTESGRRVEFAAGACTVSIKPEQQEVSFSVQKDIPRAVVVSTPWGGASSGAVTELDLIMSIICK